MLIFPDGHRMRVWEVAEPVPPSRHRFKYSLFDAGQASVWCGATTSVAKAIIGTMASGKRHTPSRMMVRVLSPKRLDLLRHVHRTPAKNIRVLSQSLGRNYRRVHEDVEALQAAGLLDRDKDGVRAEYDAFDVAMRVTL